MQTTKLNQCHSMEMTLSFDGPLYYLLTLTYFTGGNDYVIQGSMLFFPPGQTELSFTINITDDVLAEPNEVFTLELARPQQASAVSVARGTPHFAQVRVIDDDG